MTEAAEISVGSTSGALDAACRAIQAGGVVALPTDTLFGLAANVFDEDALRRVFEIKGRPASQPIPVLVNGLNMAARVAEQLPDWAERLAERFWPGPLTLILPASGALSPLITAGGDTVAVRSPDHWVPQELMKRLDAPITGTSANPSGGPDPKTPQEVKAQLASLVDAVVDLGPAPRGTASTIVAVDRGELRLVRQGVLSFEEVAAAAKG